MPPPEKPYDEMSPDEIAARIRFERDWNLRAHGIGDQQIEAWKRLHGRVGTISSGEDVFVYRALSRGEKRKLLQSIVIREDQLAMEMDFKEEIVARCVLFPQIKIDVVRTSMPDGLVEALAGEILKLSGQGAQITALEM